jgi:pumilio RNA-binding family
MGISPHGTRVVQKLLDNIKTEEQLEEFNNIFSMYLIDLSKDLNGNHIVVKYLSLFKYPTNQFVYNAFLNEFIGLSTHKHGCCVIQKSIDFANKKQEEEIIKRVIQNTYILMCDQYGNYVLQYVIGLKNYETNYAVANIFIGNMLYLSKQKFSSNVIEKVKLALILVL